MPKPFVFMSSVEAVQLTGIRASSLAELDAGLRRVDGSSIYHHTHRFYRAHSFLGPSDRSDFALWIGNNLKEEAVAERMGALDPRDFHTIMGMGEAILEVLQPLREQPDRWTRKVLPGLEFHFCRAVSLVLPGGYEARNLEEFLDALERVDVSSIYYHLIESPLHYFDTPRRFDNDFSQWLFEDAGLEEQAQAVASVDPYRSDLEALRRDILDVFQKNRLGTAVRRAADRLGRNSAGEPAAAWLRRWRKED